MNPRECTLTENYMQKLDLGFYPWVCDICINPNDGCGVFIGIFCIVSVSAASTDRKRTAIWCQGWATNVFCVGVTE